MSTAPDILSGSSGSTDVGRPRKRRKPRQMFSCTECRRMKLKCSRDTPCTNCIRRECADLCRGPGAPAVTTVDEEELHRLRDQLHEMEQILAVSGLTTATSATTRDPWINTASTDLGDASLGNTLSPNATLISNRSEMSEPGSSSHRPILPPALLPIAPAQEDPTKNISPLSQTHSAGVSAAHHLTDQDSPCLTESGLGHGTLVLSKSGRSRYVGRTAASERLKTWEHMTGWDSPPLLSRAGSPGHVDNPTRSHDFPFGTSQLPTTYTRLASLLPPRNNAHMLTETYFMHFTWHSDIVPKAQMLKILDGLYQDTEPSSMSQLALVFAVLAAGTHFDLSLPFDDPAVAKYLSLARRCLADSNFLSNNTLEGIQALHVMGNVLLDTDSARNGDSAWPLWGLAMRAVQAMGLHRDGKWWKLPEEAVEERRRVFWEVYATDIMLCNYHARPGTLSRRFVDAAYPRPNIFPHLRFEMAEIFHNILGCVADLREPPSTAAIFALHLELANFEKNLPFVIRCRPIRKALPTLYPSVVDVDSETLPTDKHDFQRTMQQFTLLCNICEGMMLLHRPYFAQAVMDGNCDPALSEHGKSYIAVVESCNAIILVAAMLQNMFPQASVRHWWIWYHAFNSAVCMGILISKHPRNPLAPFALTLIDTVIRVYGTAMAGRSSSRMTRNLFRLQQLRAELFTKMSQLPDVSGQSLATITESGLNLHEWQSRLLESQQQLGLSVPLVDPTDFLLDLSNLPPAEPTTNEFASVDNLFNAGTLWEQLWDPSTATSGAFSGLNDNDFWNWWSQSLENENL